MTHPDIDYDGCDSWDDQVAEQAQWMAEQQTGARAAGLWQEQQQIAAARRELHETRRKLKADSHQLHGFRQAFEAERDALQHELKVLDTTQLQMRNTDPGLRHDELSAVRQAAGMAEQQLYEQQQQQQQPYHHHHHHHQQQHQHQQQPYRPYQSYQQPCQDLPAGWTSALDDATGTIYYCFDQTGQCQWERPAAPQHGGCY